MNIQTDDQCKKQYQQLKFKKTNRYITFNIIKQKIVIDKIGSRQETWDSFLTALPDKDYRFAVFDFQFTNPDNMHVSKLIFINWCADNSPMKTKILYATAKQSFKKYIDSFAKDYTMSARGDFTEKDMIKELEK